MILPQDELLFPPPPLQPLMLPLPNSPNPLPPLPLVPACTFVGCTLVAAAAAGRPCNNSLSFSTRANHTHTAIIIDNTLTPITPKHISHSTHHTNKQQNDDTRMMTRMSWVVECIFTMVCCSSTRFFEVVYQASSFPPIDQHLAIPFLLPNVQTTTTLR